MKSKWNNVSFAIICLGKNCANQIDTESFATEDK